MGSPQQPTAEQYAALEEAGELQQVDSPHWISLKQGATKLDLQLPRESLALIRVSW
jgi:xylan 1,4-beta-xylosidase